MAVPTFNTIAEVATSVGNIAVGWTVPSITPPVSGVTGSGTATYVIVSAAAGKSLLLLLDQMVQDGRATVS